MLWVIVILVHWVVHAVISLWLICMSAPLLIGMRRGDVSQSRIHWGSSWYIHAVGRMWDFGGGPLQKRTRTHVCMCACLLPLGAPPTNVHWNSVWQALGVPSIICAGGGPPCRQHAAVGSDSGPVDSDSSSRQSRQCQQQQAAAPDFAAAVAETTTWFWLKTVRGLRFPSPPDPSSRLLLGPWF